MKTKLTIKTKREVILPTLPNFIRCADTDAPISISELSSEQIRELGGEWTEQLVVKARQRKQQEMQAINKKLSRL